MLEIKQAYKVSTSQNIKWTTLVAKSLQMLKSKSKNLLVLSILITVSILSAVIGIYLIDRNYQQHAIESAHNNAKVVTQLVDNARQSYSQVLQKLRTQMTIETGHDHAKFEHMVPNPATFSIELAKSVSTDGQRVWMYSDHPFPWRKNTAIPSNVHEAEVLARLNKNPNDSIFKVLNNGDEKRLFFGRAVLMSDQSCVECHNSHPYSAKTNWELGDTRAILATESRIIYSSSYLVYIAFAFVSVLSFLSIALYFQKSYAWIHSQETNRIDSLTNIPNRTALNEHITQLLATHQSCQTTLGVMMIDIDDFKYINDVYGHDIGDECLVRTAQEIQSQVREGQGFAGRWGGEEFQVLLSDTTKEQVMQTAQRILQHISRQKFSIEQIKITVSIGLYVDIPAQNITFESILKRADQALLTAKKTGKNKIVEG